MTSRGQMLDRLWSMVSANLGTKLISIVIALVLWVIVLGSRNVEVTKEIPLEVITPADLVPANDLPERIAFRLSGPKAFLRGILDRREDPIRVNLSGAKAGLVTYRFFSDNIRVPIGVKVMTVNPTAILIKLERLKRKDVPVKVELRGVAPQGYRVVKADIKPEVVRIKGAESRVDAVTEVLTTPIDISGLTQNMDREVALDVARLGVQLDSALPRVAIDVEAASANFRLKNIEIRVISSHKVKLEDKTVTVLVRATPQDIKLLNSSRVYGVIDLSGKPKGTYRESVKVTLPSSINVVRTIPDQVNVTLY